MVIAGKDKGKKGKVRFAYPEKKRVIIEGINFSFLELTYCFWSCAIKLSQSNLISRFHTWDYYAPLYYEIVLF